MTVTTNLKQLYEIDDHLWLLENIELLKQQKFKELDLENLIEELESLARKDKATVKSLFVISTIKQARCLFYRDFDFILWFTPLKSVIRIMFFMASRVLYIFLEKKRG